MCSKKAMGHVCLLTVLAIVMAGPSAGQNSSSTIEAPSNYENQLSSDWTLYDKLSLVRVKPIQT
jgi:hypothetical protein